uniref:Catalytic n=1 Tax=Rhizophora mucronata TaxID=61149 RepID=A0A2P2LJE3_RHIMU
MTHIASKLRLMMKKLLSSDFKRCQGNTNDWDLNSSDLAPKFHPKPSLFAIQLHTLLLFLLMLKVGESVSTTRCCMSAFLMA